MAKHSFRFGSRLLLMFLSVVAAGCHHHVSCGSVPRTSTDFSQSFLEVKLSVESQRHIREGIQNRASWAKSPVDTAIEYLYWQMNSSERPEKSKLKIATETSLGKKIVTIVDTHLKDDSVYVLCDRLTMHRQGKGWLPTHHQTAWQGRGQNGWTTNAAF